MSIVNEALKKAAREKEEKNTNKVEKRIIYLDKTVRFRRYIIIGIFIIIALSSIAFLLKGSILPSKTKTKQMQVAAPKPVIPPEKRDGADSSSIENINKEILERHKRALELYKEKRLAEAMAELLIIIAKKPDFASAHNNLGLIYKESDRLKEAEREYKEALKAEPLYAEAMNNLAVLYDNEGRYNEAVELFKNALRINPKSHEINLNLAITLERMGKIEDARLYYKNYLRLIPKGEKGVSERVKKHLDNLQTKK